CLLVVGRGVQDVAADALREVRLVEVTVMLRALQGSIDRIGGQALQLEDSVVHRSSRAGFDGRSAPRQERLPPPPVVSFWLLSRALRSSSPARSRRAAR